MTGNSGNDGCDGSINPQLMAFSSFWQRALRGFEGVDVVMRVEGVEQPIHGRLSLAGGRVIIDGAGEATVLDTGRIRWVEEAIKQHDRAGRG